MQSTDEASGCVGVLVTTSFFGQLGIDALAEAPVHLPALAAVLFGAMAGVEAPNPGAAEPVSFRDNTNNLFHSFRPAGIQQPLSLSTGRDFEDSAKMDTWRMAFNFADRLLCLNNQVMSPLNVHVRGLRQRPSDQPSRAICDPSTPSRLGRGRPPPAAPLTSPPR